MTQVKRSILNRPVLALCAVFFLTLAGVAIAENWTWDQGYVTGCSLGTDETFFEENWDAYIATLDLATELGEFSYYDGVLSGYSVCREPRRPIAGGRDAGTQCEVSGCTSGGDDPAWP